MTLSTNDRQLVQQMIDDFYGQRQNVLEHKEGFLHQAPETYIAKIPSGGIDPVVCEPPEGESEDVCTVTGVSCVLYKIIPDKTRPGYFILEAAGFSRTIYNVGETKISESEDEGYVPVTRTKYGKWITLPSDEVVLWRFTLNANMADSSAAADKLEMDGTDTTEDITVKDPANLFTRALDGAKGICIQIGDEYFVLECQTKAGWINFTLTANLGSSASCTRTDFGGTQQDVQNPNTSSTATTVYDSQGLFEAAITGCKGIAIYDAIDNQYNVVECQTIAGWIDFELTANMSGNSAACTVDDFGGSQNDVFNPGAIGLVVHDVQGMFTRAMIGAKGRAEYDAIENRYNVVECQSKAGWIRFSLNADLDGGSALATKTDFGGSQQDVQDPGSTITVHDGAGLFDRAKAECLGLAFYDAVGDEYVVVECQTKAGWIRFELTEDMSSGSAACTVALADFGGSQNDVYDPGRTPTVFDADGNFPNALDGAIGQAVYDSIDDKYYIVSCDQRCLRLKGLTTGAVTSGNATFEMDNLSIGSPVPFGQLPSGYEDTDSTQVVTNRYHFNIDDGGEVQAYWDGLVWICDQALCP